MNATNGDHYVETECRGHQVGGFCGEEFSNQENVGDQDYYGQEYKGWSDVPDDGCYAQGCKDEAMYVSQSHYLLCVSLQVDGYPKKMF